MSNRNSANVPKFLADIVVLKVPYFWTLFYQILVLKVPQ